MNGLGKRPTKFELFLVFCLLLGLTITAAGLQNRELLFVAGAPMSASISTVFSNNASISEESASYGSIGNASDGGLHKPETDLAETPIELNDKNFDSMLTLYSPFVVDFWEIGCRPCKSIDPTIDEMAQDFKDKIVFGKLCIDRNAASKERYEIYGTPTLLIFKDGALVYRHLGNYPKQELEEMILAALNMS